MNFGYKQMYIGGQLVDAISGKRREVICPATDKSIGEIAWSSVEDAQFALDAAQEGFEYWSRLSMYQRREWMMKLRSAVLEREVELRQAMVYEMGKTFESAEEDIEGLVNGLDFYSNAMMNLNEEIIPDFDGTYEHRMISQPAGVAVAYLAWNFPLLNVGYKIGPALASGCSIVIKPSEQAPISAYLLGEILASINFPAGVVNIICGRSSEVASYMTKSTIPRVITMIGSSATGKRVMADSTTSIKKLGMELGGNAPFIVFPDADLDTALAVGTGVKYNNCGQVCVAPNRFFVHEDVYDEFLERFTTIVSNLKIGHGRSERPDMGPLVSKADRERLMKVVQDDVAAGATLHYGGGIPKGKEACGNFMEPTILTNTTSHSRSFREEMFGPVASFMKFSDDDEVLQLANDTEYGLASYIFTKDEARISKFSRELDFGEVQVNGVRYHINLPHGGIKDSGIGHDCSVYALDDYLVKKRVSVKL